MAGYDDLLAATATPAPATTGQYNDLIQAVQTGRGKYADLLDAVPPPPPPEANLTPASNQAAGDVPSYPELTVTPEESRARAFLQGLGIPTTTEELKAFGSSLVPSDQAIRQDIEQMGQAAAELPRRIANFGQTVRESPIAGVIREPLSPESFRTYGTVVGMVGPKVFEQIRGVRGGEGPSASEITSPEGVSQPEVRPPVGKGAPLRQPGETAEVRAQPEQVVQPRTEPGQPETPVTQEPTTTTPEEVIPSGEEKISSQEVPENVPETYVEGAANAPDVGAAPEGTLPGTPVEPVPQETVSRFANRLVQPRVVAGEIGEIAPGQGFATQDLVARGLRMSPEEINQHVSDVMSGRPGDQGLQAAAIRAEEARLSQRSQQLSAAAAANPRDLGALELADNAFKDLTDFHNGPVARLKNNWHAQGMAMQGELPVDLSTLNGMREAYLRDVGKAPPPEIEPTLRRVASKVREANGAEADSMRQLSDSIERASRRRLPTADEVAAKIKQRMGGGDERVGPCII